MNADSPLVEEVRRRRYELSARFDHDLDKYVAHLRELEAQYPSLVVSQIKVVPASAAAATPPAPTEQLAVPATDPRP